MYEINLSRCIFCGYCEVACPFDAITMGHDYEMSDYTRSDLIFTKEMLLAEPIERTPLRRGGRVTRVSAVFFFLAAIGALTGAVAVVTLRNPFYCVLALVVHLICLAALFLLLRAEFVAAAQVVVYAGAVMVLYVFVVAYVGGGEEHYLGGGTSMRFLGPLFALALAVELCIAMLGSALKGVSGQGRRRTCRASAPRATSARCS